MNICMSGIDHKTATIETREHFSITEQQAGVIAKKIVENNKNISGCAFISTCNRTEIYISYANQRGQTKKTPIEMLCRELNLEASTFAQYFYTLENMDAVRHLMELSAGIHSLVFGDDQIIAQVKRAWQAAHETGATDSYIETLFLHSVTAGKSVKTNVKLSSVGQSSAYVAVSKLKEHFTSLKGVSGMVIGNGEIGRLAASLLANEGANVSVTLREYKYKPVMVPEGCATIMYSKRYDHLADCKFVVSATTSPHYTLTKEEFEKLSTVPPMIIDLAVPRDVEPTIASLGATIINVDGLCATNEDKEGLKQAMEIIDEYEQKFVKWCTFKENIRTEKEAIV